MHSLQQSIENDRINPPVGSLPGSYMLNTIQYYPTSSQAHLGSQRLLYPDNVNKLVIPNEYRRPSSAPLTPVEPKKIGRRFRRSSSVEEPSPQPDPITMHENNGLFRHHIQSSVRTCDGNIPASDHNRSISTSHFSTIGSSIMSHTKSSYDYMHAYEPTRLKTERVVDSKEINYRPYMDNHHPYNNIKKNLADRFMKKENDDNRNSFNPSSTTLSSSSYHSAVSTRPTENYFTWSQYPPTNQDASYYNVNIPHSRKIENSSSFRGSYPSQSESLSTRPHTEQLPIRPIHGDPSLIRPHHNEPFSKHQPLQKGEQDARMQAMNTYLEMLASVQHAGNTPDGLFVRSREVIIQKGGTNPNVIHNSLTTTHHTHPHDLHEKGQSNQQATVRRTHHHDLHEKTVSNQQPTVLHGGMESSGGSSLITSHNIHGMPHSTNAPWSMVSIHLFIYLFIH